MNFLGYERLTEESGSAFTRCESLFVDSRGIASVRLDWWPRCAQGRHLARSAGICRACAQEWAHAQGCVTRVDGWFNGCLKLPHDEAPVLLGQGWELGHRTAEFTYLKPPQDADGIDIPLCELSDLPTERSRAFSLKELPRIRPTETRTVGRLSRRALNDYKRIAPTLQTLEEHLDYLSKAVRSK